MKEPTTLREEFETETGAHSFADQQYIKWLENIVEKERQSKNAFFTSLHKMLMLGVP